MSGLKEGFEKRWIMQWGGGGDFFLGCCFISECLQFPRVLWACVGWALLGLKGNFVLIGFGHVCMHVSACKVCVCVWGIQFLYSG